MANKMLPATTAMAINLYDEAGLHVTYYEKRKLQVNVDARNQIQRKLK